MQVYGKILVLLLAAVTCGSGCARVTSFLANRSELMDARQEERERYREIEQQARLASHEVDMSMAQAHAYSEQACVERQREALRDSLQDKVRSKIAFDVDQALKVGQLQIDETRMKKLLDQREKEFNERQQLIDNLNKEADELYRQQLQDYVRQSLRQQLNNPTCAAAEPEPTCCCTGPVGNFVSVQQGTLFAQGMEN